MLHTTLHAASFIPTIPQDLDSLTPGLTCKPNNFVTIPAYHYDPDPMLDISAIEEENDAIGKFNYSCTSYEY